MREDDRHVGKVGRHLVDVHGIGILQLQPRSARHACADPGLAGVEDCRQLVFSDHLIEGIGIAVVREEGLGRRMELEAFYPVVLDQRARHAHTHAAPCRVDAGEGDADVAVLVRRFRDFLVGDPLDAHAALAVHGEYHEPHLPLTVVRCHLIDGLVLGRVPEIPAAGFEAFLGRFVWNDAHGFFRVRVDIDRDEFVNVHCLHGRAPGVGWMMWGGEGSA